MKTHTLTILNKSFCFSAAVCWPIVILLLPVAVTIIYLFLALSAEMISYYSHVNVFVIMGILFASLISFRYHGKEIALLPGLLREVFVIILSLFTAYFLFTVKHWELYKVLLILAYIVYYSIGEILVRLKK